MRPLRIVLAFAADVLGRVFVAPVREGRLRTSGWPAGLRPVAALALLAYAAAAVLLGSLGVGVGFVAAVVPYDHRHHNRTPRLF